MPGRGTGSESESLQAEVWELEGQLEACQDELTNTTQCRDALADALQDAINQLEDIHSESSIKDFHIILIQNS